MSLASNEKLFRECQLLAAFCCEGVEVVMMPPGVGGA